MFFFNLTFRLQNVNHLKSTFSSEILVRICSYLKIYRQIDFEQAIEMTNELASEHWLMNFNCLGSAYCYEGKILMEALFFCDVEFHISYKKIK